MGDYSKPTSQSLDDLEPTFAAQVRQLIAAVEARGFPVYVAETRRSGERQAWLYSRGYSQIESGGSHEDGAAIDGTDGRLDSHGRLVHYGATLEDWPNPEEREAMAAEFFAVWGEEAKRLGLEWGGDWDFYDPAHVQSPMWRGVLG